MATDRLALAHVIEEAGLAREGAEKVASAIFDAIHDNVATKADVAALRSDLTAKIDLVEHRLLTRLGGLMVAAVGVIIVVLHFLGHG